MKQCQSACSTLLLSQKGHYLITKQWAYFYTYNNNYQTSAISRQTADSIEVEDNLGLHDSGSSVIQSVCPWGGSSPATRSVCSSLEKVRQLPFREVCQEATRDPSWALQTQAVLWSFSAATRRPDGETQTPSTRPDDCSSLSRKMCRCSSPTMY